MRLMFVLVRSAAAALLVLAATAAQAAEFDTPAKQAILVDSQSGAVLFEKNADEPMAPSSMSKIMTVYMLFEALQQGGLSLDDTFPVSEKAWRKGGSKMFIEVNKDIRVEDLIRGIIVQSGNDASIAVAEGLAGTEESFADQMTRRATEIGLKNSTFRNATGWPDPEHAMTARDLAILADRTIRDFPEFYHYYAEKTFTFSGIKQGNRNPLLYKDVGADGLKTGHTEAGGYGLTASAERNGRRLILVLNGLESAKQRSRESARLMDWGFREFRNVTMFDTGKSVAEADVWLGDAERVPLIIESALTVTVPRRAEKDLKIAAVLDAPIPAPIIKGTPIGRLVVSADGMKSIERPLFAGADVGRLGFLGRIGATIEYLIWGGG